MTEFRFAYPLMLILLLIPPFVYLTPRLNFWQSSGLIRYSDTRLLGEQIIGWRIRLRRLPDVLRLIAWFLLVIALARPQLGNKQQIVRGEGIDIVLVIWELVEKVSRTLGTFIRIGSTGTRYISSLSLIL